MRFGTTPEYGCEVVCKVTVLVDDEYRTFTGSCFDALKRTVIRMFPNSDLTFGAPIWVQR